MKLNFRKVVPILTGAILLGSTIGFATTVAGADVSYPSDFANAVVVVGHGSADSLAAADIAADLGKLATSASVGGESVKIETSSNKLNLGENLTAVRTTAFDKSDLPTLLKDRTFSAKSGDFDYEQHLQLAGGLFFTHFRDSSFSQDPVIGIKLGSNRAPVMNYTLQFTKNAESAVDSSGHLSDFETKNIEILGKSYTILNAFNATNVKLELMGGAVVDTLEEGASKDYVLEGKTYTVVAQSIGDTKVKLTVNGEGSDYLEKGDTFKLSDGTQLGIRDFLFNSKTGSVSTVDFTLGAQKLTLENANTVQMNDADVNGLKAYISTSYNGAKLDISKIVLEWKTDVRSYLSAGSALTMPGLGSVSLQQVDALTVPAKEQIMIQNDGTNAMEVTWPFKDGSYAFDVAFANSSGLYQGLGFDQNNLLVTGSNSVVFDADTGKYFVASYASGTAAESYLLSASTNNPLSTGGDNRTTIHNVITGSDVCVDRTTQAGLNTCTIGSVVLQVNNIDTNLNVVNLTAISAGTLMDRVYSDKGLTMILPSSAFTNTSTSAKLQFVEADKDHNIGGGLTTAGANGYFNVTLISDAAGKVSVSSSAQGGFAGAADEVNPNINSKQIGQSKVFESYLLSKLATKFLYDTNPDQATLELEYHGGEAYGSVYVTSSSVVAGSAQVVEDTALTADQKAGDLVVVGGPAINSIAAQLLGLTFPTYGTDPASGFSADMAMIKSLSLTPGKLALLVAGYEKADTAAAAKYLVATHAIPASGTLSKSTSASYWSA